MLGSAGQANYAAANTSLDAIAGVLRYKGNSSLSVQWGAWTGGGMAKNHVLNRTKRLGIGVVRPIDGKHAFHDILTDEYNCNLPSPVYALTIHCSHCIHLGWIHFTHGACKHCVYRIAWHQSRNEEIERYRYNECRKIEKNPAGDEVHNEK